MGGGQCRLSQTQAKWLDEARHIGDVGVTWERSLMCLENRGVGIFIIILHLFIFDFTRNADHHEVSDTKTNLYFIFS